MIKYLRLILLCSLPFFSSAQSVTLEVRAYAQGFYSQLAGEMIPVADPVNSPNLCDTATIVLIDSASGQSVFCDPQPISVRGYGYSSLPSVLFGNSYLVGVRFRNTLHLVSLNTLMLDSLNKSIDLTVPANLCCNFDTTYGVAVAYSGDVNLDGTIDVTDVTQVDSDRNGGVTGYVSTDLNGDGIVDILDQDIVDFNSSLFLFDNYASLCLPTGIVRVHQPTLSIHAFPNPFSGSLTLRLRESHQNVDVKIYDLMGKIIYSTTFSNEEEFLIQTGKLSQGLYLVQVIADDKKATVKLSAY